MPDAALSKADLALLAAAARKTSPPLSLLQAVDTVGRGVMRHRLCTAMRFEAGTQTVQRFHSSAPEAYPVGGSKRKRDTAWARHVLHEMQTFLGEGEAAIRAHFDDHAVILGLGLRSIVNVPVVRRGVCLGTLNFLWPGELVAPDHVAIAELLGMIAVSDWPGAAPD